MNPRLHRTRAGTLTRADSSAPSPGTRARFAEFVYRVGRQAATAPFDSIRS